MSGNALFVYKPQGKTPLEMVLKLKTRVEYKNETVSYAGRLDPMAEGVLILLVGDENKNRKKYESLRKTYRVDILLGFETDTYDALGALKLAPKETSFSEAAIKDVLKLFLGRFSQEYPPYSSKPVEGKPLYYWARRGLISKIKIPSKKVEIFSIKYIELGNISSSSLLEKVSKEIDLVKGDFRQELIKKEWQKYLEKQNRSFQVLSILVECSSGAYMRSLAFEIGKKLSSQATALHISREKVGSIKIKDCIYL